ncbi:MAG: replicative DNA helicase [Rikenellaceae bacterium]
MNFYNDNLEQSILGAIIIDPTYLPDVMAILTDPNAFTEPLNKTIFEVVRSKYDSGEAIDLVSLSQAPQLRGKAAYIAQLTSTVGSGASCITHSRLLVERQMRAKIQSFATQLLAKSQSDEDIGDTMSWAQNQLDTTIGVVAGINAPKHVSEVISEALSDAEQRSIAYSKGEAVGIPTGLSDLDRCTGGWRGGQLIIVAGRPAMGKSAVMMHFAKSAAAAGVPVVLFSLEMQGRELGDRLILGGAKVNGGGYKVGNIGSEEWGELERANTQLSGLPIYISDQSRISMQKIRAHCQQMKAKGKCGMVIVDYLGLLDTQGRGKSFSREREVAEITRQAKILANELDVPIILLSQLNRESEKRPDKMPMLSDLRDSGSIEQDANTVIFIHRPYYYDRSAQVEVAGMGLVDPHGLGLLKIAKQRNGQSGVVAFSHSDDLNRIGDYTNNRN